MFTSISGHRWNAEIGDTWICSKPTQNWTSDIESWCGSAWAGVRKHVFTLRKKADLGLPSCLFLEEVKLLCCKADAQLVRKNCLFLFRNSSLTFRHKPLRAAFWRVYGVAWAFQYKPKWKKSLASRVKQERNGWHALVRPLELTSLELTLGAHPWSSPPWSSPLELTSSYLIIMSSNSCWWHANFSWAEIPKFALLLSLFLRELRRELPWA